MKTLVITGGIGSGKSAVCRHFASKGIPVYDSDSRTRQLYDSDRDLVSRISRALGTDITGADGKPKRKTFYGTSPQEVRRKVLEEAAENREIIAGGHLPYPGIGTVRKNADGSMEFLPLGAASGETGEK